MTLASFLRRWFRRSHTRAARRERPLTARPGVESLEDRCVPTIGVPSGIAVFQPGNAAWYLHHSPSPGAPDVAPFNYGGSNWIPVAGDWNGDGHVSAGVFDPGTATWYLTDTNARGAPDITPFRYGAPGWIPVVGDWGGTGKTGVGVFDPATGTFYLRNEAGAGAPDAGQFRYGAPGWVPVAGDWDGSGSTTVGVFDPNSATFYLRNENSAGAPDAGKFAYGMRGWLPVTGDWDGNHTTTVGVVDPGSQTWYLRNSNSPGAPDIAPFAYGAPGWDPLALTAPVLNATGGGHWIPRLTLRVPASTLGNQLTATVSATGVAAGDLTGPVSLDIDLNHDGRFDGPGETGYASAALGRNGSGTLTAGGLVQGSYLAQARVFDQATQSWLFSAVQTFQLTGTRAPAVPLAFEANLGQTDSQVSYLARVGSGRAFFTEQGVVLAFTATLPANAQDSGTAQEGSVQSSGPVQGGTLQDPTLSIVERLQFLGGNPNPTITAETRLGSVSNYLIGNDPSQWHVRVPQFQQVTYHNVYPGIDVVFHGSGSGLEFDFQLAAGADPSQIVESFPDLSGVSVAADGQLQLTTSAGSLTISAPVVYQNTAGGGTVAIPSGFAVRGPNQVGLTLGQYDPSLPLIVDPILTGATFLGGKLNDELAGNGPPIITPTDSAMATDTAGSIFLTGSTASTDYPTTTGVFQATNKGGTTDVFVTKMNGQATALAWSTYLGGTNTDTGHGITVDAGDDPYVVGGTSSGDFPTTAGAFQTTQKGGQDGFVVKLNAQGTGLVYSTFLGGAKDDQENSVAVDSGGNAYVTGTGAADFPTTTGSFQPTFAATSTNNGVLTKLNAQGTALTYSTFYTGFFASTPSQVLVDSQGQAVIGGSTFSSDLPMTPGSYQPTYGGSLSDGFVAKFNAAGSKLLWATYVGGPNPDYLLSITGDQFGNIYGTGYSWSSGGFPTTPGAFQTTVKGGDEAWAFKLSPNGKSLLYSTYLGGSAADHGLGIAVDALGNAYVTGTTLSTDFPKTGNALQATNKGGVLSGDAFLVQLNSVGTVVAYGSFLGGSKDDYGMAVELGPTRLILAGDTSSTTDFPTAAGAFQSANAGGDDVWVSAIDQLVPAGGFGGGGFGASGGTPPAPPTPPGGGGGGGGATGGSGSTNGLTDDRFERNDTSDQATVLGTLSAGSVAYTGLTIDLHPDNTADQDWYLLTPARAGTLTVSLNNIQSGGDLWVRVMKANGNGTLTQIGSSTLSGATTQRASAAVNAGDQIYVWVFGFNFATGFYDLGLSLA